jgi:hypothetical protein
MTLEEKIEIFEEFLEALISRCAQDKLKTPEKYYDYIERIVSLQNLLLTLRRRKQRIDDRWILRGEYE